MNKKIIWGIIVLIIIVIGAIFIYQNSYGKVYVNEKYEFSFGYPSNWLVDTETGGDTLIMVYPKGPVISDGKKIGLSIYNEPMTKLSFSYKGQTYSSETINNINWNVTADGLGSSDVYYFTVHNNKTYLFIGPLKNTQELLSTFRFIN